MGNRRPTCLEHRQWLQRLNRCVSARTEVHSLSQFLTQVPMEHGSYLGSNEINQSQMAGKSKFAGGSIWTRKLCMMPSVQLPRLLRLNLRNQIALSLSAIIRRN